jgi:restriction endonuclease Mrr
VLVSTAGFTKGSRQLAEKNSRLELIDGRQLVLLMNQYLGPRWPLRIDFLVSQADMKSVKK